ncbi:MAG: hypothetical protein WD207_08920 [Xanthobacteraceae bacterium]
MTALAATTTSALETSLADLSPCPSCGELLVGPKTSTYLGLGRIEHFWHCDGCGTRFQTSARLAGMVEAPAIAPRVPVAASR